MWLGIHGVRWGIGEFLQVMYTKPLDICYNFAAVLNVISLPHFWGEWVPQGATMVLLGKYKPVLYLALFGHNL